MYTTLLENYLFIPNTQTIVSLDLTQVRKECIQYIVNKTTNEIIWDRMKTAMSDISCSGNTIHFDANNAEMNSTDILEIGYIFQKPESLGIGLPIESAATTDTGEFTLISLFKRSLEKLTDLINQGVSGLSLVKITDGAGVVNTKTLGVQVTTSDVGLVTNTVIHGKTTAGGSTYVDVKVNPSGALTTEATIANLGLQDNANSIPIVLSSEQAQDSFITGAASQSALGNNILLASAGTASLDTFYGGVTHRSFYCQIKASAGISSGQIIFEGSNDNVAFHTLTWVDDATLTGTLINAAIAISANTNRFFSGRTGYRYVRCRISTAFVGGTVQAITRFSVLEYSPIIRSINPRSGATFSTTISSSLPSGASAIGDVGIQARANATGAASKYHLISAATTNAATIKASAGRVLGWNLANTTASWIYVKLHNITTLPVAGTNVFTTIAIAPNSTNKFSIAQGIAFTTGIGITTVTGSPDNDTNAVTLGAIVGDLFYA
jgi:hypothetical protein